MAEPIEYRRIRQKVDTFDNWMANPLILGDGEQAFVRGGGVVLNFRMGDGTKRFSELPNVIQYDQAAYVAAVGNILPVPQNGVGYSIIGEGIYNDGDVVVTAGNFGIASFGGDSWEVELYPLYQSYKGIANVNTLPTNPREGDYYQSGVDNGFYQHFNLYVYNEFVNFKYVDEAWRKEVIKSYNNITPEYNSPNNTDESVRFMRYIRKIELVQKFNSETFHFIRWIRYKSEGYTGIMVRIDSLPNGNIEFQAVIDNVIIEAGKPLLIRNQLQGGDLNRFINIEFSIEAPQEGFTLNGNFFEDSLIDRFSTNSGTNKFVLNEVADTATVPSPIFTDKVYPFTINGVYANFNNLQVWNEKGYFFFDKNRNQWQKRVTDSGDFDTITVSNIDQELAARIRRIVHSIKLVDGFNFSDFYFIKRIAYKSGGEAGIYLLIQSLPNGAFEFEWRISNFDLIKGDPIKLVDTARNKTVILTISKDAPETFDETVINFQDGLLSKQAFYDASWNLPLREIKTTRVTLENNNDYALRNKISSLRSTASYYNRYIIVVPKGRYFDYDVRTNDYIDVEGVSAEDCVFWLDGNSTKVAPEDVTIGIGGVPINEIPVDFKHIFWNVSNCNIRNITLEVNNVKYAVHQDAPRKYEARTENVIFKDKGSVLRLVGIGGWENQKQIYKDCYFDNTPETQAIGWHNWTGQNAPSYGDFINCKSKNTFVNIAELGSEQADIVRMRNCSNENGVGVVFTVDPQDSTPPLQVPYCIKGIMEGKELTVSEINRPNYKLFK